MCLFNNFKRTRKNLIKKLSNPELSPEDFLNLYQDLHDLFFKNNDLTKEEIERIVEGYLISKGIERNANQEISDKEIIKEDNEVVRQLLDKMIELEDKVNNMQEYIVKNMDDMRNTKNLINKKLRVLSNIQDSKRNKKVRSKISVD